MQMAIDVAGFTPAEADQLRQAMGSKRSRERMERLRARLLRGDGRAGHHRRGGRPDLRQAGRLRQLRLPREPLGVASPTSSTRRPWIKLHYPAAFCAGAAQRPAHGLLVAPDPGAGRPPPRRRGPHPRHQRAPAAEATLWSRDADPASGSPRGGRALGRLGVGAPRGRRAGRARSWPSASAAGPTATWRTSQRRVPLHARRARGPGHRRGLRVPRRSPTGRPLGPAPGAVGRRGRGPDRRRPAAGHGHRACTPRTLPGMSEREEAVADLWATGVSPEGHPTRFVRDVLDRLGVVPAAGLAAGRRPGQGAGRRGGHPPPAPGHRRRAPCSSTWRTRPGLINVVCSLGLLDPLPPGGPQRAGAAGAGPAREGRRGHQRGGRAARRSCPWRATGCRPATSASRPRPASGDDG